MQEFEVIYEDSDMLALNKPAGIVVHHDAYHSADTIVDWVKEHYPKIGGVGEDPLRPGIVHRLDKDTSGVLLIAKNQDSFLYLKNLFKIGGVQKTYKALVVGDVKNNEGVIDAPIARSTKNFQKRVVGGKQGRSREAITSYHVIKRFKAPLYGDLTLLDVLPKTGRTHQIRSHVAHIGHPVVCDQLYGGKRFVCPEGLSRQFLHAFSIQLEDIRGKSLYIEAPLPADLSVLLEKLRK